jgi:hypothetical protein
MAFSGKNYEATKRVDEFLLFGKINDSSRGCLRTGSAAMNLAYLAEGKFGGCLGKANKIWDVAAGLLLAKLAGSNVQFKEVDKEQKALGDRRSELDGYMDILDAMSGGDANINYELTGHGSYFNNRFTLKDYGPEELIRRRFSETFAQLGAAWSHADRADWNRMKERLPRLTHEFERIMKENKDTTIKPRLLSVLTGSLKRPPDTLSHHLEASPIIP